MDRWELLNTKRYYEYIENIIKTRGQWNIPDEEYFEAHHIIFSCFGGTGKKLSGKNKRKSTHENLIWLLPEEHWDVHEIMYIDNIDNTKCAQAFCAMKAKSKCQNRYDYKNRNIIIHYKRDPESIKKGSDTKKELYKSGVLIPWNKGKTGVYSKEWYIEQSNRQKGENNSMKNVILTKDQHKHYSDAAKLRGRRPVYCEELGMIFNSPNEAHKFIHGDGREIEKCCNGERESFHNYHWGWFNDRS